MEDCVTISVQEFNKDSRLENFNLATKWEKQRLTWRVTKFPSNDLSDDLVIRTMERAFSVWSKYADLTFIQVSSFITFLAPHCGLFAGGDRSRGH